MTTRLLGGTVWEDIRRAVRHSKRPVLAAIAYFGKDGTKLLPLRKGSRLVVDASDNAVKSGQTHPNSLLELHRKGVVIYSVSNFHAKVLVVGNRAFVGSANVSTRSENTLVEAVLETTEPTAVRAVRKFIRDLVLSLSGQNVSENCSRHINRRACRIASG